MTKTINNNVISQRKGEIVNYNELSPRQLLVIKEMELRLGELTEVRKYKTGSFGAFFKNNQFRFITGDANKLQTGSSDNSRLPVTDLRWINSPSNNYKRYIQNNQEIKSLKKKQTVGLKDAVDMLRQYYS